MTLKNKIMIKLLAINLFVISPIIALEFGTSNTNVKRRTTTKKEKSLAVHPEKTAQTKPENLGLDHGLLEQVALSGKLAEERKVRLKEQAARERAELKRQEKEKAIKLSKISYDDTEFNYGDGNLESHLETTGKSVSAEGDYLQNSSLPNLKSLRAKRDAVQKQKTKAAQKAKEPVQRSGKPYRSGFMNFTSQSDSANEVRGHLKKTKHQLAKQSILEKQSRLQNKQVMAELTKQRKLEKEAEQQKAHLAKLEQDNLAKQMKLEKEAEEREIHAKAKLIRQEQAELDRQMKLEKNVEQRELQAQSEMSKIERIEQKRQNKIEQAAKKLAMQEEAAENARRLVAEKQLERKLLQTRNIDTQRARQAALEQRMKQQKEEKIKKKIERNEMLRQMKLERAAAQEAKAKQLADKRSKKSGGLFGWVAPTTSNVADIDTMEQEERRGYIEKESLARKSRKLSKQQGYPEKVTEFKSADIKRSSISKSEELDEEIESLKDSSQLHLYNDDEDYCDDKVGKELSRIRKIVRGTELAMEHNQDKISNQIQRVESILSGYEPVPDELELEMTGNIQTEAFSGKSTEILQDNYIDSYGFGQQTVDLGIGLEKKNRDRAYLSDIEAKFVARTKGVFGNHGIFANTEPTALKIGISRTEQQFQFQTNKQLLWAREAWFKYNWHWESGSKTSFTAGMFPYQAGCGLAFGNANNVGRQISALYTERFVDQFRSGVKLEAENSSKTVYGDMYYGVISNKSSSINETGSFIKANRPDFREKPYRGYFVENNILAAQLKWKPQTSKFRLMANPYVVYNENKEDKVELLGDATSALGVFGVAASLATDKFEFYSEFAVNFGQQNVKDLDRNIFEFVSSPRQTFLFQDPASRARWTIAQRRTFPEDLAFGYQNCDEFTEKEPVTLSVFKNACNRFRKKYKNSYRGLMAYTDVTFTGECSCDGNITWGICAGFASGDDNPNDSKEKLLANRMSPSTSNWTALASDHNKDYTGFTGVQQMFPGRSVKNVFLMDVHKLNRPVSTTENRISYPDFTNLFFFGSGVTIDRMLDKDRSINCSFNLLGYLQQDRQKKGHSYSLNTLFKLSACPVCKFADCPPNVLVPSFQSDLNADASRLLGRILGWEANMFVSWNPLKDLSVYLTGALFFPGSYYEKAQGKFIPLDMQFKLSQTDFSGFEQSTKYDITLGNATAMFFNAGVEYSFDTLINLRNRLKVRLP